MSNKRSYIIVLLVISLVWVACQQERQPCMQPKVTTLRFGTYYDSIIVDSAGLRTVKDSTVILPSPYVGALDSNKVTFTYYGILSRNSQFAISLSPVTDSCKWIISPDSTSAATGNFDTLTFYYDRKLQFLSNACGYTYYYNLHSVQTTYHMIDSVIIKNFSVTSNANIEHIKVYVK